MSAFTVAELSIEHWCDENGRRVKHEIRVEFPTEKPGSPIVQCLVDPITCYHCQRFFGAYMRVDFREWPEAETDVSASRTEGK